MIDISFTPPCAELMKLLELSPELASCTVNEQDSAVCLRLGSRFVSCQWFSDETIILVDAQVSRKNDYPGPDDDEIAEVMANLVLELRPDLPAGGISREMGMEEILAVVAQSFGLPVRCDPKEPFSTLYSGPGGVGTVQCQVDRRPTDVGLIGTFRPDNYCEQVWAFDVRRYREWLAMLLPGEKGISRCGTLDTWYEHPNADWTIDRRRYVFAPRYGPVGILLLTMKQPGGTLMLRVSGPFARRFTFRQPPPQFDRRGMHVVVTWDDGVIKLFLNGKLDETRRVR